MFVVAGVTGNTGRVVADTLLTEKKPVRVIVRDEKDAAPWRARGAEAAVVDLDDAAALTNALRGAEGVSLLLPPQYASSDLRRDNARRTAVYVKAIDASGVKHVVFLSSQGAELANGTGPITSLHDAEEALRGVGADLTIVRAAYFMENWGSSLYAVAQGKLPSFVKAERTLSMVAARDIGATIARALVEGGKGKRIIELSGPREYTPGDVAEALARVVGKPIALDVGPEEAMIGALTAAGLNDHWAHLFQEMTHALNAGTIAWQGAPARAVRGKTTIDEVLAALVAPKK